MDTTSKPKPQMQMSVPACDVEIEEKTVGALLFSAAAIAEANDFLDSECFTDPDCRGIYEALMAVYNRGDPTDISMVLHEIACQGGGVSKPSVIDIFTKYGISVLEVRPMAMLLREYKLRRRLWTIGSELAARCSDPSSDILVNHTIALNDLRDALDVDASSGMQTLGSLFNDLEADIVRRMGMADGEISGTPTGFYQIDRHGGFQPGEQVIIAAETSKGKTSLATAITMNAIAYGHPVAFYSMEMTGMQLAGRIASMRSGLNSSDILHNKLTYAQLAQVRESMDGIDLGLLHMDEKSTSSYSSIAMSIRRMKLKHDIKGAVVDYLQLVGADDKKISREQQVGQCARDFKNLAKELGIWIIVISQLNRNDTQHGIPSKARLRDSGQIEEAADLTMLIHRPDNGVAYPGEFSSVPTVGTAMIICDKGRNIGVQKFICGFKPENTLFYPLSPEQIEYMKANPASNQDPFRSQPDEVAPF